MAATEISVSLGGVQIESMPDASRIHGDLVDLTAGDGSEDDTASASVQDIGNVMAGQFDFLNPAPVERGGIAEHDSSGEVGVASRRAETENGANPGDESASEARSGGVPEAGCGVEGQLAGKRNREDDMQCMICLEAWSNSGEHRIASLACGHVFGTSCITRWLGEKKFCPSCNAPAKRSHIRTIFVTNLVAMDTTEKDRAVKEMIKERESRRRAESQKVRAEQALMQLARTAEGLQSEVKKLKAQLAQAQAKQTRHQERVINHEPAQRPSPSQDPQSHTSSQGEGRLRSGFKHLKSYSVMAARVFDFSLPTASVLVSWCSDGATHTLCKINFLSGSQELMPPMHSKPIRDCRVEPQDGQLVLTCSLDKSVKVTSIASNNCVQEYKVEKELWSCCWHPSDRNVFFCGGAQNSLFLFDLRDTSGAKLVLPGARPQPTHSLAVIASAAGEVQVLGGTLGGLSAWTIPSAAPDAAEAAAACRTLALPGRVCTCVASNAAATLFLASFRRGAECEEPRHVLFKYDSAAEGGCEVVETIQGGSSAKVLSRSAIVEPVAEKDPPGDRKALVASADENSMQSWLWGADTPDVLPHRLYPHASPVLDTQARGHLLGSLSESRLYLYELKTPADTPA